MELKPQQKGDPVWSILPSYDMYQYTFNGITDPPKYGETASVHESVYTPSRESRSSSEAPTEATALTSYDHLPRTDLPANLGQGDTSDTALSTSSPSLIVADEATHTWRETLLDNIDNLRNYSESDNKYMQSVELSVHFTEDVGKRGEQPNHVDPSHFEYKQGDYLNGYIYIRNTSEKPIPFDMFYVLFEGNFAMNTPNRPINKRVVHEKKFLEMYDFAASWNQSQIDRLLTEIIEDQHARVNCIDPRDGASLGIVGRTLMPGVLYKRFFTFKIPHRLLDTECNNHNLPSHTCLPPTLGLSEKEKVSMGKGLHESKDFSFQNTATNYKVLARFIGRASHFKVNDKFDLATKLIDAHGDEFIIFKECNSFVRVIQESNLLSSSEKQVHAETARILYENFLGRIREKIALGHRIKKALDAGEAVDNFQSFEDSLPSLHQHESQALKSRQLYTRLNEEAKLSILPNDKPPHYEICISIIKKKLLGVAIKYQGMLQITSPRTEYILNYISPKKFNTQFSTNRNLWKLEIPVRMSFQPADTAHGQKMPFITSILPEIVAVSMRSVDHPLPVELTHHHLFHNKSCKLVDFKLTDDFEHIVQIPMREHLNQLSRHLKHLGKHKFKVEKSLLEDMVALAKVDIKKNTLRLREALLVESNGELTSLEGPLALQMEHQNGKYTKDFTLVLDATKAQKMAPKQGALPADYFAGNEFCLVPSFQNCSLARLYYIRLIVTFSTGEQIELKLPLTIAKMPGN